MKFVYAALAGGLLASASAVSAAYVDDEFNGSTLGSQWTWFPGTNPATEPTTSTYSIADGYLTITPAKGTDQYINGDGAAYIEQDRPSEAEWSVETRISNFNPVNTGFQHRWTKAGLSLVEDNNSWISLFISSNENGTQIHWYGQAQLQPASGAVNGAIQYVDEFQQFNIGYFQDYYLRLSKTNDGYRGEMSYGDGSWFPVTPLLRNPNTADGTIPGKIRLFMGSGVPEATKNPAPAQFDYVRKTVLSTTPAAYADDEFNGSSAAQWRYVLGDPLGTVSMDGSAMVMDPIATSVAGGSDITQGTSAGGESGVLAYQNAPDKANFSVYTRVSPTVFVDAPAYQGHGIRVWQNQNNWAGLKAVKNGSAPAATSSRNTIEGMFITDNNTTRSVDGGVSNFVSTSPTDPAPEFLRVDKFGSSFRLQYSFDGLAWTVAFHDDYPGGWFNLNLQPNQPLLVQLFSQAPRALGTGTIPNSRFEFIREINVSNISDWQLY